MSREELEKEVEVCMHNALFWLKLPISKENVEKGSSYIFELLEPREKRIEELEEKISILLSCNSCPDNKGGLLCQKEYEDKCLAQKIQYIKELKEENAELKKIEEEYYDFIQKKNEEDWKGDNVVGCLKLKIEQLKAQIEKMKCCENCAKNGHICVAEEMQGKLCGKNKVKWQLRR